MVAKIAVHCGAILSLVIAIVHTRFYAMFSWKSDYEKIGPRAKIPYTIHVALYILFFGISYLSFVYVDEIASCKGLGFGLALILSLFWLWRTIWQLTYLRLPKKMSKNPMVGIYYGFQLSGNLSSDVDK